MIFFTFLMKNLQANAAEQRRSRQHVEIVLNINILDVKRIARL